MSAPPSSSDTTRGSAGRRRRAPPEARRAQILAAAFRCFSEKGYHPTTMDDVVRASGLSKGALYWHFEGKQDVFLAVFDAFAAEVFDAFRAVAAEPGPVAPKLRRLGDRIVALLGAEGRGLDVWIEFFSHPRARERFASVYRQSRELIGDMVRDGIARGEIRDLPVEGVAAALTAAIEGLMLQAMVDGSFDVRAHAETLWQILERGVAA